MSDAKLQMTQQMMKQMLASLEASGVRMEGGLGLEDLRRAMSHAKAAEVLSEWMPYEAASVKAGRNGRVAYKGGMGPMFFRPREWEEAIAAYLDADPVEAGPA